MDCTTGFSRRSNNYCRRNTRGNSVPLNKSSAVNTNFTACFCSPTPLFLNLFTCSRLLAGTIFWTSPGKTAIVSPSASVPSVSSGVHTVSQTAHHSLVHLYECPGNFTNKLQSMLSCTSCSDNRDSITKQVHIPINIQAKWWVSNLPQSVWIFRSVKRYEPDSVFLDISNVITVKPISIVES